MENTITRKQFISGNFKEVKAIDREHPIAAFLRKNRGRACNVTSIAKAVKMAKSSCHFTLRKLVKKGLVVTKKPYFMWKR